MSFPHTCSRMMFLLQIYIVRTIGNFHSRTASVSKIVKT